MEHKTQRPLAWLSIPGVPNLLRLLQDLRGAVADDQQIAVPETLLKKRRTNEATREAKLKAVAEARQVGFETCLPFLHDFPLHNDAYHNVWLATLCCLTSIFRD